jgi:hypothetical protein
MGDNVNDNPTPEVMATWQRRLASQANNRAWHLAEASARTSDEDEEMLQAAHAAMYFWKIVGDLDNRAHAAQLLAHVYALLRLPNPARHYLAQAKPVFLAPGAAPWAVALFHAVAANVACAGGDSDGHRRHYEEAQRLVAALPDPEDRSIINATLGVVPQP